MLRLSRGVFRAGEGRWGDHCGLQDFFFFFNSCTCDAYSRGPFVGTRNTDRGRERE
ncbi:Uncharacterized protein APZ42_020477 [Daphnia magna]|uniref:Uncharacterized protein n=1 Tax=Daphnia magna TaxID=35525 RepID=A0A164XI01_9CRUS|nr:Uncharacterized protein APZ42_020477 [Daphnia magna]